MLRKNATGICAIVLIFTYVVVLSGSGYAAPSVKLIINPNRTEVELGTEPIALTAKATGANLTYSWELKGPGKIDGEGSAVFYVLPDSITGSSAQALVTVTITDASGQQTTETVTFNILAPKRTTPASPAPATQKTGMSRNTKIALGVGAAAALGGGIALLAGGGDDDDDDSDGGTISVFGDWEFTGSLIQDGCDFGAGSSFSGSLNFIQNGSNVAIPDVTLSVGGTSMYFSYAGSIRGKNVSLAAVDPYVWQSGGTVIHLGSGVEIQNIKNNAGSGSFNITGDCIQGCTGNCQTAWSGNWTRVNW